MASTVYETEISDVDNGFLYEILFDVVNDPANSPVMQKKTGKWEPSTDSSSLVPLQS